MQLLDATKSTTTWLSIAHLLLWLVLVPILLPAQQIADTLFIQADQAAKDRQFDAAYTLYDEASRSYAADQHWENYLKCRVEMARSSQFTNIVSREAIKEIIDPAITYIERDSTLRQWPIAAECYQFLARYHWAIQGNYESAILAYQKALDICGEIGDSAQYNKMSTYADLSHVYSNKEAFGNALTYASDALELSQRIYGAEDVENGPRYYSLGFIYYRKGNYDRAIQEIQKGIQILQDKDGPEIQIGLGYNNLSAVYVAQLDQEGARQSSVAAEQILSKFIGPNHESFGVLHWDLGVMYSDLEQYEQAERETRKAIEIFESNFGSDYPQLPDLYHHLGLCLDQIGQFTESEIWHKKAYQQKLKQYGETHPRTAESYRRMSDHFLAMKDFERATWAVDKGLAAVAKAGSESNLLSAWLNNQKGILASRDGTIGEAMAAFDLAIAAISLDPEQVDVEHTINPLFYAEFQSNKSAALYQHYLGNGEEAWLRQALFSAKKGHDAILKLRSSYHSAESKLFLQKRARTHYDLMLEILYELWVRTQDETHFADAWNISEQTKSLLLLEELKGADLTYTGVPTEKMDSLKTLREDLSFYQNNIIAHLEMGDSSALEKDRKAFFRINNQLQVFETSLESVYPQYGTLQGDLAPLPFKSILVALDPSCAIVEYYLADTALHIFLLKENEFSWTRSANSEETAKLIKVLIDESRNLEKIIAHPVEALSDYNRASQEVHQILFPEMVWQQLQDVEQIVVVPDRELGYISFEALKPSSESGDYLISNLTVSYAYSATLRQIKMTNDDDLAFTDFGGFAPSYPILDTAAVDQDLALLQLYRSERYALPGAEQEVSKIHEVIDGDIWLNELATESTFKSHASSYNILHLSLHGLLDEENPIHSRLLFHQDSLGQGDLNAYEIYGLDLNADLAVLSACNTGAGKLESGEGILSLSRAFAFAGVPNLVASLWRADDASSSSIMVNFYLALAQGRTKDVALRAAKLQFLASQKTETYRHPYFWAPYILIGENISHFYRPRNWFLWGGSLVVVLGLLALYFKKRLIA